jgi:hypothetical protein
MPGAAQELLDHGVLRAAPVYAPVHRPEVDDVAYQRLMLAQEIEQTLGLAGPGSQVNV